MKHFIDAITAADNDAQRRQITRDQLGMQDMNWESFGLGALAGDAARFGAVLSGQADGGTWALRIVGLLATLAVVWLVGRAARRAFDQQDTP